MQPFILVCGRGIREVLLPALAGQFFFPFPPEIVRDHLELPSLAGGFGINPVHQATTYYQTSVKVTQPLV